MQWDKASLDKRGVKSVVLRDMADHAKAAKALEARAAKLPTITDRRARRAEEITIDIESAQLSESMTALSAAAKKV